MRCHVRATTPTTAGVVNGGLQPFPMTHAELATFLEWVAEHVRAGDSWEGSISWQIPDTHHDAECEATAVVRYGNLMGQGAVRMIGTVP